MNEGIGRLERVPLREVWRHEAYDFTRWLEDNIDVLNSVLDLNLVSVEREQLAGSFSVDLVAEEQGGGRVVIENQLGKSDHDHLGKLITYLTAMTARAAIWIVSEPRPEHVAAVAWLNESANADFYLVKVEAVRIGASPPAPLLTVIVGPSAEAKTLGQTKKEFTERYDIRQRWWSLLITRSEAKLHAHITPGMYSWIGTSSGVRGLNWNYVVMKEQCAAELYIDRGKDSQEENERIFDQLLAAKAEVEEKFGGPLQWERLEGKRACRIRRFVEGGYRAPEERWDPIQEQVVTVMTRLEQALRPHLKALKLGV